jgi:hypothetical protein
MNAIWIVFVALFTITLVLLFVFLYKKGMRVGWGWSKGVTPKRVLYTILCVFTLWFFQYPVTWVLKHRPGAPDEKSPSANTEVVKATPPRFCWSKPEEVKGARPELRSKCMEMQVSAWTSSLIAFSVFHQNLGKTEESVFFLNRAEGSGRWKNIGELPGHGVWEMLPTPEEGEVKLLGRMNDETEDNEWITFMVRSTSPILPTPPPEAEVPKKEFKAPDSGVPLNTLSL